MIYSVEVGFLKQMQNKAARLYDSLNIARKLYCMLNNSGTLLPYRSKIRPPVQEEETHFRVRSIIIIPCGASRLLVQHYFRPDGY